jgi:hypothetical protein
MERSFAQTTKRVMIQGQSVFLLALQLVGKTKSQITFEAFVYFGSYIEEQNVVSQFTLGTGGQMSDYLDFSSINSDFGWLFFYFLGCKHYHDHISLDDYTYLVL